MRITLMSMRYYPFFHCTHIAYQILSYRILGSIISHNTCKFNFHTFIRILAFMHLLSNKKSTTGLRISFFHFYALYNAFLRLSQKGPYPSVAGVTGLGRVFLSSTKTFPSCPNIRIRLPNIIDS